MSTGLTQTASGPELRLQRRLERRGPVLRRQRRQPAGEIGRLGAEGVVEGVDPPDRPGDEPAERPQRLGLGAEPAGSPITSWLTSPAAIRSASAAGALSAAWHFMG